MQDQATARLSCDILSISRILTQENSIARLLAYGPRRCRHCGYSFRFDSHLGRNFKVNSKGPHSAIARTSPTRREQKKQSTGGPARREVGEKWFEKKKPF